MLVPARWLGISALLGFVACGGSPAAPASPEQTTATSKSTTAEHEADAGTNTVPDAPPPVTNWYVRGKIVPTAATRDKVRPGNPIFIGMYRVDAAGNRTGAPVAVDRLEFSGWPVSFSLDSTNSVLSPSTTIRGKVLILAWWDQDHDAMTQQPGDVGGALRTTVPAAGLELVFDKVNP